MFGLGWTEILIIAAIAVLVVPPKDLPGVMRSVGQGIGKMRRMAGQFQRELESAVRDEELDKLQKEVSHLTRETNRELNSVTTEMNRSSQEMVSLTKPKPITGPQMTPKPAAKNGAAPPRDEAASTEKQASPAPKGEPSPPPAEAVRS